MIIISNIAIPSPTHDEDFCTPDFQDVINYYPFYANHILLRDREYPSLATYMMQICKYLEKSKARKGRTADVWFQRYLEHFGLKQWLEDTTLQWIVKPQ